MRKDELETKIKLTWWSTEQWWLVVAGHPVCIYRVKSSRWWGIAVQSISMMPAGLWQHMPKTFKI